MEGDGRAPEGTGFGMESGPGPLLIQGTRAYLEGLSREGVLSYPIPPKP